MAAAATYNSPVSLAASTASEKHKIAYMAIPGATELTGKARSPTATTHALHRVDGLQGLGYSQEVAIPIDSESEPESEPMDLEDSDADVPSFDEIHRRIAQQTSQARSVSSERTPTTMATNTPRAMASDSGTHGEPDGIVSPSGSLEPDLVPRGDQHHSGARTAHAETVDQGRSRVESTEAAYGLLSSNLDDDRVWRSCATLPQQTQPPPHQQANIGGGKSASHASDGNVGHGIHRNGESGNDDETADDNCNEDSDDDEVEDDDNDDDSDYINGNGDDDESQDEGSSFASRQRAGNKRRRSATHIAGRSLRKRNCSIRSPIRQKPDFFTKTRTPALRAKSVPCSAKSPWTQRTRLRSRSVPILLADEPANEPAAVCTARRQSEGSQAPRPSYDEYWVKVKFRRARIGGKTICAMQWEEGDKMQPPPNRASDNAQSRIRRTRAGFTTPQNDFLIEQKTFGKFSWKAITEMFNKRFEENRSQGTLQVHYSKKLKGQKQIDGETA
ncbi:hypothetical protein LEL_10901 [Akanthomyces lecanii RCEF 1005]|uniref:Myb-like domain-containing protein n=1 Tax=Akanthomyces lecanii RCEF 1005 TaxID=1081108 RepID=A0A167QZR0_CORDF|nr:hypothetical protein LEL_10901 [Akanthomyces lecanii RCEF 1005]